MVFFCNRAIYGLFYNYHFTKLYFIIIYCNKLKNIIIYFLQKSYIFFLFTLRRGSHVDSLVIHYT